MLDPQFQEDDWRSSLTDVDQVRRSIDDIDASLLTLLGRRMYCSHAMGQAKRRANPTGQDIVYRPGREASVLARLVAENKGLPTDLVYRIWRQIFSASCQVQQTFHIGYVGQQTQAPALLHFGAMGSFEQFESAQDALAAVAQDAPADRQLDMAILPFGPDQDWWQDLPERGLFISASVPTLLAEGQEPSAVVVTRHACDPVVAGSQPGLEIRSLIASDGQPLEQRAGYVARGKQAAGERVIGQLALVAVGLAS